MQSSFTHLKTLPNYRQLLHNHSSCPSLSALKLLPRVCAYGLYGQPPPLPVLVAVGPDAWPRIFQGPRSTNALAHTSMLQIPEEEKAWSGTIHAAAEDTPASLRPLLGHISLGFVPALTTQPQHKPVPTGQVKERKHVFPFPPVKSPGPKFHALWKGSAPQPILSS